MENANENIIELNNRVMPSLTKDIHRKGHWLHGEVIMDPSIPLSLERSSDQPS
jgi:hypothetical protein